MDIMSFIFSGNDFFRIRACDKVETRLSTYIF